MLNIDQIPTFLGWSFISVLPGTFKRNRAEFMHHDYPILAPLPANGTRQRPLQGDSIAGPFIYLVQNDQRKIFYVGKSLEENVLKRWIRPGSGGPASYYWSHSTRSGGCVFNIAEGLRAGEGPFHLRFAPLSALRTQFSDQLGLDHRMDSKIAIDQVERALIRALNPAWNRV
jgi:hypothetical protein